jgi:hypothetical protein
VGRLRHPKEQSLAQYAISTRNVYRAGAAWLPALPRRPTLIFE